MKKVFTENLVKTWKGISWNKTIGEDLEFIYDDINGKFKILDYNNPKKGYIKLLYKNKEFYIHSSNITKNKIGDIIGKINREMKYKINQTLEDKSRNITIIDLKHENGKKTYKYLCNVCGFNCGKHYSLLNKEYKDELWISEYSLNNGCGCSCCGNSPKTVVEGINSIVDTDTWMIPIINNLEFCKTHTSGTEECIYPTCPSCGKIKTKKMQICQISSRKSIGCTCSDGKSYIEKYMVNLLEQLKEQKQIKEIKIEERYDWCKFYNPFKNKNTYGIYDFILEDIKLIIETDGAFHRKDNKMSEQTKEESIWLDNTKDELAKEHGYKIIRISDEEYIKQNILTSDLSKLFDLDNIDWIKCDKFALSNLIKIACNLKKNNINLTTVEISKTMGYCQASIIKWLKKGSKFGWCNYNPKEEQRKSKIGKRIKCIDDGRTFNSITEASKYYSTEDSSISAVCNGKRKTAGKRKFEFIH